MSHAPEEESLPVELRRAVDACCDRYEQAWRTGDPPRIVDFVRSVPVEIRHHALRELIAVELEYARGDAGQRLTTERVVERYQEFADELGEWLAKMPTPHRPLSGSPAPRERKTTLATGRASGSAGLHIRCPHCQVALELLPNAALDDINCSGCGSNFSLVDWEETWAAATTPKQIGRFQLVGRIGVGGFGSVWQARDADLDRSVAIKIPRKGHLSASEMELFFREARAAAQLRHPNIVPVHEVGRDGDTIFIVSELILGESFANWLMEQHSPLCDIIGMLAKVADALHFAHERGIVHRDFKPSNVMIDQEGEPHLMDFGLAKREVGEVTMTIDGLVVGTPAYMSPEQATGGTHWVDRRTDVYSLGVVLFEVLTGELPFRGNAQMQIRDRMSADPPHPRRLNQKAPLDLATICLKCLEREPNRRYGTAAEVAEELRRYLEGKPIESRPISQAGRLARWARRNPWPAAAAVLTAVLAVAGPVAAIVINGQRISLASQVDEYNRLIKDDARKLDESATTIQALMAERDKLSGKPEDMQQNVGDYQAWSIDNVVKSRYDTLNTALSGETIRSDAKARGHLGLAYLLVELNDKEKAREQLLMAVAALKELQAQSRETLAWRIGLKDCYQLLATIGSELGDDNTNQYRLKAIELSEGIVRQSNALEHKIERLDALTKVEKKDIDTSPELMRRWPEDVKKLQGELVQSWPSDANGIYELACYLTHRQPTLLRDNAKAATGSTD